MHDIDVPVTEDGPRDRLQSIERVMPAAHKLRRIEALAVAGVTKDFVPASGVRRAHE